MKGFASFMATAFAAFLFACPQAETPSITTTSTQGSVAALRDIGTFDAALNPVVPGGLPPASQEAVRTAGWQHAVTTNRAADVYMVFASQDIPGGYSMWKTSVSPGTEYVFKPDTGYAAVAACGNPTCWRWLVNRPETEVPPMLNEGQFDAATGGLLPNGVTSEQRKQLLQSGWRIATTNDVRRNVEMVGRSTAGFPGPVLLRKFDVAKGTEYFYNPKDGRAVIASGGNATVWQWLAAQRVD